MKTLWRSWNKPYTAENTNTCSSVLIPFSVRLLMLDFYYFRMTVFWSVVSLSTTSLVSQMQHNQTRRKRKGEALSWADTAKSSLLLTATDALYAKWWNWPNISGAHNCWFFPSSLSSVLCDILFKPWPAIGLLKWHQRLYAIKMSIIHILTGKHYCSWSKSWLMLQVPNKWALTHTNTRESHTHTQTHT